MTYNSTPRRRYSKAYRADFLDRHGNRCYWCGKPILSGQPWAIEHKTAREMMPDGSADAEENLAPIHAHPALCHKEKTKLDVAQIAKSNHVRIKHGLQESRRTKPKPVMRTRGFDKTRTRKMNGAVVARK